MGREEEKRSNLQCRVSVETLFQMIENGITHLSFQDGDPPISSIELGHACKLFVFSRRRFQLVGDINEICLIHLFFIGSGLWDMGSALSCCHPDMEVFHQHVSMNA